MIAGQQWIDNPYAAAYPMDHTAASMPPQQAMQLGAFRDSSPPALLSPTAADQEMIFQWVDCPNYLNPMQQPPQQHYPQQHYPQAPSTSPYYQGEDIPPYGVPPRPMDPGPAVPQVPPQPMYGMDPSVARYPVPQAESFSKQPHGGQDARGGHMQPPWPRRTGKGAAGGCGGAKPPGSFKDQRQGWSNSDAHPAFQGRDRRHAPGTKRFDVGTGGGSNGATHRGAAASSAQDMSQVLQTLGADGVKNMLRSILESLYKDRIKPLASYVKGRLKERSCPEPIVKSFPELYSQHGDKFRVEQQAQGDESVIFFAEEPYWFKGWVDIDSPEDPYDESMWTQFAKILETEQAFTGGRYGMAKELMQRDLKFLSGFSFGEVIHIVQLAIQNRKLIVYHRKMLKPMQAVLGEASPTNGVNTAAISEGNEIKSMDELIMILFRILALYPDGIPLSRIKQTIKREFQLKLSETVFQCTKLIELFNQAPLSSTFVLQTDTDGKSITVKAGAPASFTDHVKQIYMRAG